MFPDWVWFLIGAVLLMLELFLPAFYLIFIGAAAIIVGVIAYFIPINWQIQMALFAIVSIIFVFLDKKWIRLYQPQSQSHPDLNDVMQSSIGKEFALLTAIENGRGQIKIGDSLWVVTGKDMQAGEKVKIIAVKGQNFTVIPV